MAEPHWLAGLGPKPECWVMLRPSGNEASHRQLPAQWKSWGPREAPLMIHKFLMGLYKGTTRWIYMIPPDPA